MSREVVKEAVEVTETMMILSVIVILLLSCEPTNQHRRYTKICSRLL
jgi:hypothetical protein